MLWTQERPLINMNNVVSIKNLTISFEAGKNVVDNVSIDIPKGKTVAIVGESGSGKTLSALSILKLLPTNAKIYDGSIIFNEKDLQVTKWGTVKIDFNSMETNLSGVFAAGDIVRGASLVVWAIKDGRDVAISIDQYLKSKTKESKIVA